MIQLGNPLWLWGLSGLFIPLAIHLLSRKEGKVIPIGSLRHLSESDTARFSSIRLNEIVLLIVRCLLISLIVLLLAGTRITGWRDTGEKWLLADRGVEKEEKIRMLIDSLKKEGYEVRQLARGFPSLADSGAVNTPTDYWTLAEELGSLPGHEVIVISNNYLRGFSGKRPTLPGNVRWLTADGIPQSSRELKYMSAGNDSVWVRMMEASPSITSLTTEIRPAQSLTPSAVVEQADTIRTAIYSDDAFDHDRQIFQACLLALQGNIPYRIEVEARKTTESPSGDLEWLVWLSEKNLPPNNARQIAFRKCAGDASPLLISPQRAAGECPDAGGSGAWVITKRLTEESALSQNFPLQLASVLLKTRKTGFEEKEALTLAPAAMWSQAAETIKTPGHEAGQPIDSLLAIVFFQLLAAERYISFRRNQ